MIDLDNWGLTSVEDVAEWFDGVAAPWWIAGGWALDLFLGTTSRAHKDVDIQILRTDQLEFQRHFRDWELFKANQPGLAPWPEGEFLDPPVYSVWARRESDSPWAFDIKLMEIEQDCWVYRRLPSIRGKIDQLGLRTGSGIPYIAPEIQLLYKSAGNSDKDRADLEITLPRLHPDQITWLLDCLRLQYQDGHEWIGRIEHWSKDT